MGQKQGVINNAIGAIGIGADREVATPSFKRKVSRLFDGLDDDGNGVLEKQEVIMKF